MANPDNITIRSRYFNRNVAERYLVGESISVLAAHLMCSRSTISRALKAEGVEMRRPAGGRRAEPGTKWWAHGYIVIAVDENDPILGPMASRPSRGGSPRVLEHRAVMALHLGRPLVEGEEVHHKNGVRHDNRIENLELWVKSQPVGQRAEDLIAWAQEILERYAS